MSNERALADELARQADRLTAGGPGLDDVLDRARTIRRRRRIATGAAALVTAAVLAPAGLWLATPGGEETLPGPAQSPTQVPDRSDEPDEPEGPLELNEAPRGAAPAIPYLAEKTLHLPDGSTREVDFSGDFVLTGDAVVHFDGEQVVFDRPGTDRDESFPATTHPAANADRDLLAWGTQDGLAIWTAAEGARTFTDRLPGVIRVVNVSGDASCQEQGPGAGGCILHYQTQQGPGWVDSQGTQEDLDAYVELSDLGGDLVAGATEVSGGGSCSRVEWEGYVETCDYSLLAFSGDPGMLAATDPYLSGHGLTSLTFLDMELQPIQHWEVRSVTNWRWEDETHLLASVYDESDRAWYVVRFGADGSTELATDPIPGDDAAYPVTFEGQVF